MAELKRELGVVSTFAVGAGAMISSGLFVLPAMVFALVGPGAFLCYLLASVLLVPSVFTKGELMTAMPKAGGTYYHIDRSFGPGFGMVGGVCAWASLAFKSAFALLGIGALAAALWPGGLTEWEIKGVACASCLALMLANLTAVRYAGRMQIVLVVVLLAVLVGYAVGGMGSIRPGHYAPLLPHGWKSLLAGTALVFISYGGVTKVAALGEEVRSPRRDLLVGMMASFVVVSLLYVLVVFVTIGLLPRDAAHWTLAPLSQAAGSVWNTAGTVILAVGAMCAFLTTGNAGILAAARTTLAMSQDRLLPRWLSVVSRRNGAPTASVLFTSAFMMAVILFLDLTLFVKAASAMMLLLFMFELVALVLMRESRIPTYRPTWRCPGYPWLQIFGVLCYGFLLVELGSAPLMIVGAILAAGITWYGLHVKVDVMRESALVRVAARLARSDFQSADVVAELSRFAHEHDEDSEDEIDRLIRDCAVLDLEGTLSGAQLLEAVAGALAGPLGRPVGEIRQALERREAIAATIIRPGLAIPHLIMEGLGVFHILLVRCRDGVLLGSDEPPIHALVVLAASPAQRNLYLKTLVAVAEITQEIDFDRKWLDAPGPDDLRTLVLEAERRRELGAGPQAAV